MKDVKSVRDGISYVSLFFSVFAMVLDYKRLAGTCAFPTPLKKQSGMQVWCVAFLIREASHIDFVHEKRHMDVGGWGGVGACDVSP